MLNMKNEFVPINVIRERKPLWKTPDFNPNAEKEFKPYGFILAANGISPQTQAGLLRLEEQMKPQAQVQAVGVGGVQSDPRATIQLPNGQYVTPEQYQKLLEVLKKRK